MHRSPCAPSRDRIRVRTVLLHQTMKRQGCSLPSPPFSGPAQGCSCFLPLDCGFGSRRYHRGDGTSACSPMTTKKTVSRCAWVPRGNALYERYHDTEWGVPVRRDTKIFEFLVLESAQAGLSLEVVLKKSEGD